MQTISRGRFRAVCTALAVFWPLLVPVASAMADPVTFDIPAEPLPAALRQFAEDAHVQLLFDYAALAGLRTKPLKGVMEPDKALALLLTDSGYRYQQVNSRTIAIQPVATAPSPSAPGDAGKKEGKKSASTTFRMAQMAQAAPQRSISAGQQTSGSTAGSLISAATLQEVVVTALHQSETLQTVPAAVTAISGEALQRMGAKDYSDYLSEVPGVTYAESIYNGVFIRGVSAGLVAIGDPLTAIYIDEAPITQNIAYGPSLDPLLYDVQRVEVLKGPQGTLYGASSMGGTVRIIMNEPQLNQFNGSVSGTAGSVYHGAGDYETDGVVNIPLVDDHVALRVVATARSDGGFIDDVFDGRSHINSDTRFGGRASLLIQADTNTSVLLSVLAESDRYGDAPEVILGLPEYDTNTVFRGHSSTDARLYGMTIRHDFGWASLVSASNYLDRPSARGSDVTYAFAPLLSHIARVQIPSDEGIAFPVDNHYSIFTQEVRLASEGANRLDWLIGAFYSNLRDNFFQTFDFSQAPALTGLITANQFYLSTAVYKTRQLAGFGQLTYNITARLSASAGVRVFQYNDRHDADGSGFLNGGTTAETDGTKDSSHTQKYLLKFQATKNNMLYAQASEGFRDGGTNQEVPTSVCSADLAGLGYTSAPGAYGPDTLWNYEVGSKNSFLDQRAKMDVAAYYIDWKGIQSTINLPTCGFNFDVNGGRAVSKGVELDTAFTPLAGVSLTASGSYDDAYLTEAAAGTGLKAGDRLPEAAKWSANLGAQYDFPVTGDLSGYVHVGAAYVGDRWNEFPSLGPLAADMSGYWLGNARFGIQNERWSAALFVTNLFNVQAVNYESVLNGPRSEIVGESRVIGVNGRFNF